MELIWTSILNIISLMTAVYYCTSVCKKLTQHFLFCIGISLWVWIFTDVSGRNIH